MTQASPELTGLRGLLHGPDPVLAAVLTIPDPGIAAILGWSGFDFVLIDFEHGPFTLGSARNCVDALKSSPAHAAIRVAANDPTQIKQALDLGADGVQVPVVSDVSGAAAAVGAARYSPEGSRGVGAGHAARYGSNLGGYLAEANSSIAVLAMIEDGAGVENAAEIAAVDGLDAVVIGPLDLAADLGHLSDPGHPDVEAGIASIVSDCVAAGMRVGTGCDPEEAGELAESGISLFACYFDGSAIGRGAAEAAAEASEQLGR